jgi:alpha-glutamyl/putrescinyl thymine pyrophosphorylase clade 1
MALPAHLPGSVRPSEVFNTYWRFAAERQEIFFRRLSGATPPWTTDSILQTYKMTNAYRASDRVSQYLIRNVVYEGTQEPRELFFRILLFKIFNRIDTWELLSKSSGQISFADYRFDRYDAVLNAALSAGTRIYSPAYIMPAGGPEVRKHRNHLHLIERMMRDNVPERLQDCGSMEKGFSILRSYPMLGDFLAYQFITDLNYSTLIDCSEMEFVLPGPGAKDGIRKCFHDIGRLSESDIVRMMADIQEEQFTRLGIQFRSLWGRRLHLIDCQNLFCEVGKYARCAHPEVAGISGRTRIKQRFRVNPDPIRYWYPPKWGINDLIKPPIMVGDVRSS